MSKAHRLVPRIAAAAFIVSLAACGGGGSGAVATVNGQTITHADLDKQLETSPAARSVLQQTVTNDLIDQYAQAHNITVSAAEIDKVENQYKRQYPDGQWDELLKARGMTDQDVRNLIRRQLILDKSVGHNIKISDAQIKAYYARNRAQFDQPAQAHARHILVAKLSTAQKVEADLKAGKDFTAEAKQYSIDPGSKDKGGDLGWFRQHQMVPQFDQYAFSAQIGKISAPIKSEFGYHIIQVQGRKSAQPADLAKVHDQIATTLRQQQEAPLIPQFLQQLQSQAKINIQDPAFAGMFPSPVPSAAAATAPAPAPTK